MTRPRRAGVPPPLDGRQFVVAEIDDFETEVRLVRENAELMEFLRQRSAPGRTYTLDEVRKELNLL